MFHFKILVLFVFLFTLNCTTNKVANNHGFRSLETKYSKIKINESNKNDIIKIIGPPSYISDFNENKWFFIERRKTNQSLLKLGIKKIEKNNVLIVNFNKLGILVDKKILDINNMNDITYVKTTTVKDFQQDNFVYNLLSSLREKINAPARNRGKTK